MELRLHSKISLLMQLLGVLEEKRFNNTLYVSRLSSVLPVAIRGKTGWRKLIQWVFGDTVRIVSDYGLDGRGSIPDRRRGFFL
jgi:hypothetical protein